MRNQSYKIVLEDVEAIVRRTGDELKRLAGKTLCVTGANGLLPRYLIETVAWCNENLFPAPCRTVAILRHEPSPEDPLWRRAERCGVTVLVGDARAVPPAAGKIDYLVLAATKGSPRHYLREPVETLELNGAGLGNWLRFASQSATESVLYLSSGEVYGTPDPDAVPTPETYVGRIDPAAPRSVYAEGKRYGEALCLAHHRAYGVPVRIVRPFQVFGPGVTAGDGRAFSSFAVSAALGEPIVLESAGAVLRTFMYLADATVAFWKVLLKAPDGSIYNVGSPAPEVSILELAHRMVEVSGGPSRVVVNQQAAATQSPARTCPDIGRLQMELGFQPEYGLDATIRRTIEWVRQNERP